MTNLNYANRNLQNCSFKGQDLTGGDFSGSDLRGCNFKGATLTGANFEGVKTGQSSRQVKTLVIAAIVGPVILVVFSAIAVKMLSFFGDRSNQIFNLFPGVLSVLILVFKSFIKNSVAIHFPQVTAFSIITAIASLLAIMIAFTVGLAIVGLIGFKDGLLTQGFFSMLLMVVSTAVTFRILKWLLQSIKGGSGTSFRRANLTDAIFSHSVMQNTDFSLAVLTGICIFDWAIKTHTQFTNVHCEYLYLEPSPQNRRPAAGNFQRGELEQLLTQFRR